MASHAVARHKERSNHDDTLAPDNPSNRRSGAPRGCKGRHQLGRFWLYLRPDTQAWTICWLDHPSGSKRPVLRRRATGFAGGRPDRPPQGAIDALEAHYRTHTAQKHLPRSQARLNSIFEDWLRLHVSQLAAPDRYEGSVKLWREFLDDESREGRIAAPVHVSDIGIGVVRRFVERRRLEGVGGHGISRDLAALRGALNWAWKHEYVESVPFIPDIPPHEKAPPRSRVLNFEEIAALLEACRAVPEREHLIRFIVIELGTAGRPEAVLQLSNENIDLERGLIDFNQPGRRHLRKRRSIVPIAQYVLPWVTGIEGKLIKYRAPIALRNRQPDGPAYFERDTASIKTGWGAICRQAGVAGATPKTLRHTMLTWLATRGVPREQREQLAGHAPRSTTSVNYEHLTPDYLRPAIRQVDEFFVELQRHTDVFLRSGCDPGLGSEGANASRTTRGIR